MTQRISLTSKITLSYVFGVIGSLLAVSNPSPENPWSETLLLFAAYFVAGILVSWPLYLAAVVAAIAFPRTVAGRPGLWTSVAVLIAVSFSFLTLPYDGHFRSLATLGALAALLAGFCFYCIAKPMRQISN
ncbi:hypothetical protein EN745_03200 [Mesorhizobium sp. M4A.F.Ca.ET.022.05.2.1]|uniref:hypothetical protein n=1 Tax=unclassified Mesorhizobium TaxID=325217 RepID=UPI000FCA6D6C|nr:MULTISPECIES: hypothetical protein [unclassified Mesorhizobium]RVC83339.1 hypothetical protein EN745_03200 [Mesorhizobium sp. M4A.F.Ca.ET.022.05.2.1]RVD73171.1 hypothetical protein EN751_06325 [Mesorhizobium sp. M4A.F.Ca.ET.029.04.2.1]TIW34700.1 MAG: hypothetical protein E5V62_14770 [Mesorhizobium sp.]